MSDHIEERLRTAALEAPAVDHLRGRITRHVHTRQVRARAVSGAGLAALALLVITAIPRSSSAAEAYAQVNRAFAGGKAFRITMRKQYEGEPERMPMIQVVHPNGFASSFFGGSAMEFFMREDDRETVLYFPNLQIAQRPIQASESWRKHAPNKEESLLAYIRRRFVQDPADEDPGQTSLDPVRVVHNIPLEGRTAMRLDFESQLEDVMRVRYQLFADQKTMEPFLLRTDMERKTKVGVRRLRCEYAFQFEEDAGRFLRDIPPANTPIIDMRDVLVRTKAAEDISPLFGGIRRAFRGPHGELLLVTKKPSGVGTSPVRIGSLDWLPCSASDGVIGDEEHPDFYFRAYIQLEDGNLAFKSLPFPQETRAGAWPEDAFGLVNGRTLVKQFTEAAFARAKRYQELGRYNEAKMVFQNARKNEFLLVPGVNVLFKERIAEIDKLMQR